MNEEVEGIWDKLQDAAAMCGFRNVTLFMTAC